MNTNPEINIFDLPQFRNRVGVFRDRAHAGSTLAGMLGDYRAGDAVVLAVPAGGVPVAAEIARELNLDLDVAVVSKVTPPQNTEVGYGAVAFDGTVMLNTALIPRLGLTDWDIERGVEKTTDKVAKRVQALRGDRPLPKLSQRTTILVDDGLASGFTLRVAVEALRKVGGAHIIVAVPTAHQSSAAELAKVVEAIYCPNLRAGLQFAVADAYRRWSDVDETEAAKILAEFTPGPPER